MDALLAHWTPSDADQLLGLYPVPTGAQLTVRTATSGAGRHQIDLYSSTGQLVRRYTREQPMAGERHWPIEVADLPVGVYHLRWSWGDAQTTRSFVKGY